MHSRWGQGLTLMQARGVGPGVAQPHIKALIEGCKGLGACDAVGHPAHGRVQDAMHEEDHIPSACRAHNSLLCHATIASATGHNIISWWTERIAEVIKPGKCTDAMRRSMPTFAIKGTFISAPVLHLRLIHGKNAQHQASRQLGTYQGSEGPVAGMHSRQ